jgi:undecaprenyl-diphosphatase
MIEILSNLDKQLFLFLNGFHNAFFDKVMWQISTISFWVPFYIFLLGYLIYRYRKQSIFFIITIAVIILISDQLASSLIKPLVERLRPSHEPSLEGLVYIVNGYVGGNFGFVSSHAANTFGLAVFLSLLFKNRYFSYCIILWASIVSYSRVYLGVHYPGDVICGAVIGIMAAWLCYFMLSRYIIKNNKLA